MSSTGPSADGAGGSTCYVAFIYPTSLDFFHGSLPRLIDSVPRSIVECEVVLSVGVSTGSLPDNPSLCRPPTGRLLSPSRCLCDLLVFLLAAGGLSAFVVLHPHAPFFTHTHELSLLCVVLAFACQVWPLPEWEVLGSAPSVLPVTAPQLFGGGGGHLNK